jgi:CspA family cold shock protein
LPQSLSARAKGPQGGNHFSERSDRRVTSLSGKPIVGAKPHSCGRRRSPFYDKDTTLMPSGTVKWFNAQKGYGFIQPSDGGKDVFVHISAVEQAGLSTLNEGQKISFDIITTDRGRTAAGNLKAG